MQPTVPDHLGLGNSLRPVLCPEAKHEKREGASRLRSSTPLRFDGPRTRNALSIGEKLGVLIIDIQGRCRASGRERHNAGRVSGHARSL
jgi:hypothetical protein